jgi:hypothetical protein
MYSISTKIRSRCVLPFACGLIAVVGAAVCHAQDAGFETVSETAPANVLPPALVQSTYFQIADEVRAEDNFYHFTVSSDFGTYQVSSVAMLRIRLHEIVVLAEMSPRLQDAGLALRRSTEGRRGVDSDYVLDIFSDPVGTASQLFGNLRYNLDKTLTERVDLETSNIPAGRMEDYMDPDPHKRSAAAQIGVDVYSTNQRLQDLLEVLGKARSAGRVRDTVAPLYLDRFLKPAFGSGVFDARLRSILKNNSAADVNAEVDRSLDALGVDKDVRVTLLTHPAYSPRSRLYLAGYLSLLDGTDKVSAIAAAATRASTEADAVAYGNVARMLAFYHLSVAKLESLLVQSGYGSARTVDGRTIVALPIDYLAWTDHAAAMLKHIDGLRSDSSASDDVVLLAGAATEQARRMFEGRGIGIKQYYSF